MFVSRSTPMTHQLEAVKRALRKPMAFAHMAETGTGKSAMVLYEWQQRVNKNELTDLLVIAPNGCIRNWYESKSDDQQSELETHLDPMLLKKLLIANNRKTAADRNRRAALIESNGKVPRALFVNIEALSRGKDTETELLCRQFLSAGKGMMVIDESTTIRHGRSSRTKAIMRLAKFARSRRILTGLIVPRSPLDLFYQMYFLDPRILNFNSFVAFRARYAKMRLMNAPPEPIVDMRLRQMCTRKRIRMPDTKDWTIQQRADFIINNGGYIEGVPLIDHYQNLNELRTMYEPYCYRVMKKDCLDLKPKVYEPRDLTLTPEQTKIYKDIRHQAMAELKSGKYVSAINVLSQMVRLHQIVCGHVKTEDGEIEDIPSRRIDAILDILEEHDGKAIIWVTYDRELRKTAHAIRAAKNGDSSLMYGPQAVACFWGGNVKTRAEDEKRFLGDPNCRFMLSTPQTGGKGNTWNVADLVIFAANSYDLEHRYQAEDRNHRVGQTKTVTYIDLITRGTVEEKIVKALRKKLDLARIITGANYEDWLI
jgi:hypothetical protein